MTRAHAAAKSGARSDDATDTDDDQNVGTYLFEWVTADPFCIDDAICKLRRDIYREMYAKWLNPKP